MMGGGGDRRLRWTVLTGMSILVALASGGTAGAVRPVSAGTCFLDACLPSPAPPAAATAPTPTPSPAGPGGLLGLPLPPCLVCVSPPLPLPVCGLTAGCRAQPPPPPAPSPASPGAAVRRAAPVVPAAATSGPDPVTPGVTVIPRTGSPVTGGSSGEGLDGLLRLAPPAIAQLSPVSGLSFGGALRLWPALVLLDVAAFIGLIVVLRRTWSRAPVQ